MTDDAELPERGLHALLGPIRWVRESLVVVVSLLVSVLVVAGLMIGEVRLADAAALGALTFAALGFLLVRVRRIYPRVFPSGPGGNRRSSSA